MGKGKGHREERPTRVTIGGRFSRSLVTRYAHHPLLSRPDRAQPGALRAASGRGRGWECTEGNDNEPRMTSEVTRGTERYHSYPLDASGHLLRAKHRNRRWR